MSFFRKLLNSAGAAAPFAAMVPGVGWGVAAGLGAAGAAGGAMSRRANARAPQPQAPTPYDQATAGAQAMGAQAEGEYVRRATNFDPYAAAEKSAQGQFAGFRDMLMKDLTSLRGQQSAMGRLRTGFATDDEDRVITDSARDMNQRILGNANQAASMDLANTQSLGQFGAQKSNEYYNLLSGGLDRQQAAQNARSSNRTSLLTAGAGVAGSLLGTEGGAKFAGQLGKGILGLLRR